MNLKTSISMIALGAALVVGTAVAGSKSNVSNVVTISISSAGGGTASGYLGHIYNSSSRNEYIGCQKSTNSGLFCHAKTEAGVHVACSSNSAYLANAVGSLAPDVRLVFRWNASGTCTGVSITHSSQYQDKQG